MRNSLKATTISRVPIPNFGWGVFDSKKKKKLFPNLEKLKVKESIAYPVKDRKMVNRYSTALQARKSDSRDYTYRTTLEGGKPFFRVWRIV